MSKRTPEEILRSIEESEVEDEIDRALSMSAEERRAELQAAGYRVEDIHAKADAAFERVQARAGGAEASEKRPESQARGRDLDAQSVRRPRRWIVLAAAIAAAIPIVLVVAQHLSPPSPVASPRPVPEPVPSNSGPGLHSRDASSEATPSP